MEFIMQCRILRFLILSYRFIKIIRFNIKSILLVRVWTFMLVLEIKITNNIQLADNIVQSLSYNNHRLQYVVSHTVQQWYNFNKNIFHEIIIIILTTNLQYSAKHMTSILSIYKCHLNSTDNIIQFILLFLHNLFPKIIIIIIINLLDSLTNILKILNNMINLILFILWWVYQELNF